MDYGEATWVTRGALPGILVSSPTFRCGSRAPPPCTLHLACCSICPHITELLPLGTSLLNQGHAHLIFPQGRDLEVQQLWV